MVSKIVYEDTALANSAQASTISEIVTQYYATGFLPVAELNRKESTGGESHQEIQEGEEPEHLFGNNIREAIQSIKALLRQ